MEAGPASRVRRHRRRFGSLRRVGRQAHERSGNARRAGLRRPAAEGRRLPRARAALRAQVPGPRQRSHPAHAARAEGLLRLHRIQRKLVLQRHRRAVHHRAGQAVFVARPHARHRRAHQRLGPPQLPLLAAGSEGLFLRRRRRRLAARLQGPRSLLRAGRGLCRHLRHGREQPRAARQQVPAVDAAHLRRGPRSAPRSRRSSAAP